MKSLTIGRNGFALPLDAVTITIGVLGIRGSGKTHTASVVTEEMLAAGMQVIVVDPLDCWWGLRTSIDGKKAGYPVTVLGGEHADIPLEASSGQVVADFAVEHSVSLVLSLRHFSKTDQRRFVADFCERLYRLKGKADNRSPLHVVIDEADEVAPQRLGHGAERCFGAVDTLVRRGRSSGIGVTLISQRAAAINKDVLTQIELLVAHRVISPQDRKAIDAWIEAHPVGDQADRMAKSLASLKAGECWVWSPSWLDVFERIHIRQRRTFDSSATPKAGARVVAPSGRAEVDLKALQERMATTIAKAEAEDPRVLKRRIAELEKQVANGGGDHSECEARETALRRELLNAMAAKGEADQLIAKIADQCDAYAKRPVPTNAVTLTGYQPTRAARGPIRPPTGGSEVKSQPPRRTISSDDNGSSLPKGEHAILSACIQHGSCTREQLTVLTGYKRSSRDTYVSRLRERGLLAQNGAGLAPTDDGLLAIPDAQPLPTGARLRDYWMDRLPRGEGLILHALIRHYPQSMRRDALSDVTEFKHSSRDTYISRLRARNLIEVIGPGEVRASAVLFE